MTTFSFSNYKHDRGFLVKCFQWEFLRRNPKYQKNYANYAQALDLIRRNPTQANLLRLKKARSNLNRWKLMEFRDPMLLSPNHPGLLLSDPDYQDFMSLSPVRPITTWYRLFKQGGKLQGQIKSREALWKIRNIKVIVDLTASKAELLKAFSRVVDDWKRIQSSSFPHRRPRMRVDALVESLRVYDLRQARKTFRKIAKTVYGSSGDTTDRGQEDRANKAYQAALRLIDGDYQKISL